MDDMEVLRESLEYTPTWVVATVCSVIVIISLLAERFLYYLGKFLRQRKQESLFEALQKLKEELMILGFISLLLIVFQNLISHFCIPESMTFHMLPCKLPGKEVHSHKSFSFRDTWTRRKLLFVGANSGHCKQQGKVPLLSIAALHHLHIYIFVLAVVHVISCATTMILGGAQIRKWKHWEDSIRMSFLKQFYASLTKSDYTALRSGFITTHCRGNPNFDFHKYMMRVLESDFKQVVGISWYLWLFVVTFMLLNIHGWHSFFWLSFLPLVLLLAVGAKLEHVITRLAQKVAETIKEHGEPRVTPSDEHFWFNRPGIILYLIHFILFQNSFELAFFFWIWSTFGFDTCIMEKVGYIITRLIIGILIQVLCSYSTLPLYAIVTQVC
ncbi:MLO-like protein 1 [Acorus gramineus]|uniref:MLO-like protein 1 n=1 Tax=Acorus gramineus TaxID=55184 RepID=A0AAV9AWI0_ACOGR|nr:MLO-like protein 1 [Acorus gramineus]